MRSPVHLVLFGGEELLRPPDIGGVINNRGVYIQHLLIETLLTGASVADAFQHVIEIVALTCAGRIFQPRVVHHDALDQVLAHVRRSSLAKLCTAMAADTQLHGYDSLQPIVPQPAKHLAVALNSNM